MPYRVLEKTVHIAAVAAAGQTLPEPAAWVRRVDQLGPAAFNVRLINWPIVRGTAPGANEVRSDATPRNPSASLTFGTALTANDMVVVRYIPVGAIPASQ